jgi:hypothetical protein
MRAIDYQTVFGELNTLAHATPQIPAGFGLRGFLVDERMS